MNKYRFIAFIAPFLLIACGDSNQNKMPERIGKNSLVTLIKGDSAKTILNDLHRIPLSSEETVVAEYGQVDKDILYLSRFINEPFAKESFELMLEKMQKNPDSPFTHIVPMKTYNNNSYMTLGMGYIHYVYRSAEYVIWLSTKQKYYNKLPTEIIDIYPVE